MDLSKVYKKFPTEASYRAYLEKKIWGNEPICPYCKSTYQTPMPKEERYHCNFCNKSYSVTTGTIFHKTRVDIRKWIIPIDIIVNDKDVGSRELARLIDVTKDTAALMLKKIYKANVLNRKWLKAIEQ